MNITQPTALTLQALTRGHSYAFDIMHVTGLPSGTVYPLLRRLEREKCVVSKWEDARAAHDAGRPRRRHYAVTAHGKTVLARAIDRFAYLQFAISRS
jgi:DNA-binding PadR family transcriptional regulator